MTLAALAFFARYGRAALLYWLFLCFMWCLIDDVRIFAFHLKPTAPKAVKYCGKVTILLVMFLLVRAMLGF